MFNWRQHIPYCNIKNILEENSYYSVRNGIIEKFDVVMHGHFRNMVTLHVLLKSGAYYYDLLGLRELTRAIGIITQSLWDIVGLPQDDNEHSIKNFENQCVRIVLNGAGEICGIGHWMNDDKFVLVDEFMQSIRENEFGEERK